MMNQSRFSVLRGIGLVSLFCIAALSLFVLRAPIANAILVYNPPAAIPGSPIGVKYIYYFCRPRPDKGHFCGQLLNNPPDQMPNSGKPPYVFRINGTGLPFGLTLNHNGTLSGTPNNKNRLGVHRFQICVTDGFNIRRCGMSQMLITAQPFTITATKKGNGGGTITFTPKLYQLVCNPKCHPAFPTNERVVITAHPNANSTFTGWGGDCHGTGTCNLVMTRNRTVTYTFTKKRPTNNNNNANTSTNTNTDIANAHYSATLAFTGDWTDGAFGNTTAHVDATMDFTDGDTIDNVSGTYSFRCTGTMPGYTSGSVVGATFKTGAEFDYRSDQWHLIISSDNVSNPTLDWSQQCTGASSINLIKYVLEDVFSTNYGNTSKYTSYNTSIVNPNGEVIPLARSFDTKDGAGSTMTYSGTLTVDKLK